MNRLVSPAFVLVLVSACKPSGNTQGEHTSCNNAKLGWCTDFSAEPGTEWLETERKGCVALDGVWSTAPCPAPAHLRGTCTVTTPAGTEIRRYDTKVSERDARDGCLTGTYVGAP